MKEITEEIINGWKAKYGDIYKVEIDGKVCFLHKPDRKVLGYVASIANNPIKQSEALLNNCWVDGDDEIKTNDELFFGVSAKLNELILIKQAEIVKL